MVDWQNGTYVSEVESLMLVTPVHVVWTLVMTICVQLHSAIESCINPPTSRYRSHMTTHALMWLV